MNLIKSFLDSFNHGEKRHKRYSKFFNICDQCEEEVKQAWEARVETGIKNSILRRKNNWMLEQSKYWFMTPELTIDQKIEFTEDLANNLEKRGYFDRE